MPLYPFDPHSGRRRSMDETVQFIEESYGCTLVNGFERIIAADGARHNTERVASFGEFAPYEAWYANQSGTASLRWATAPVPATGAADVLFLLSIGLGNGSALPQPTGQFDLLVNGEQVASLRVVKHHETWVTDAATVHYDVHRLETAPPGLALILDDVLREESFASFGMLLIKMPRSRFAPGQAAEIAVRPVSRVRSSQWFKVDKGTNVRFHGNFYRGLEALSRGRTVPTVSGYGVYFGDIHTHSGQSDDQFGTCGTGTVDENYRYARDVSNLDFYALTEHDWQTGPAHWETLMHKVEAYNAPDRFATIPAFEWTSLVYGHRNVYYADAAQPYFLAWQEAMAGGSRQPMAPGVDSPADLWRKLDALNTFAITIPHHPSASSHPLTWEYFNPTYDRLVELYSSWGSSEFFENRAKGFGADRYPHLFVRPALDAGLRFGFCASSDGHDGNPGNAQSPDYKHHHLYHYRGSGLTAVLAPDLSRRSVLDALHDRRCYATTGEPILLDVALSGHLMGRELRANQVGRRPVVRASVTGTTQLQRVEVIKNGKVVSRHECYEDDFSRAEVAWEDPHFDRTRSNYYYVKVLQKDEEMAWSSPVFVDPD